MRKNILSFILTTIVSLNFSYSQIDTIFTDFPELKGEYFDTKLPGDTPQVFAPFLLDYKKHHIHSAPVFNPQMDELFFSVYLNNKFPQRMFHSKKVNGVWQKPQLASFSGKYQDGGPKFSPDGNVIYFYSRRPIKGEGDDNKVSRIWYSQKQGGKWYEPKLLEFPKGLGIGFHPGHHSSDGTFYFGVKEAAREYEMYKCNLIDNRPTNIERMNEPFSMKGIIEGGTVTDPENRILIFDSYNRYGNKEDLLHITEKLPDETWSEPKILPKMFNTRHGRFAGFTPDGKYFFFCSYRNGDEQIFWIKAKVIYELAK